MYQTSFFKKRICNFPQLVLLRALPLCQCSLLHIPSLKLIIAPEGKDDEKEGHGMVSLKKIAPGKNVVLLNCH